MNKYVKGLIAGFIATVVISLLMLIKAGMGINPEFNVIKDLTVTMGTMSPVAGWVVHFILGTVVWGVLFAVCLNIFKGPFWVRGIQFSILLWIFMMVVFMPVVGNGFFAAVLGLKTVAATFVLHVIFGFVLGLVYSWLPEKH